MRRICYSVAMSLDGYIASPQGESDWIVMDPEIDFRSLMDRFDTLLMGRRTYEQAVGSGGSSGGMPGVRSVVVSRTLRPEDHPKVTVIGGDLEAEVDALRRSPGKDIWLFGGGELFRNLLAAQLVDSVEVAVIPVLLGGGRPLLPGPADRCALRLSGSRVYPKTGTVALEYTLAPPGRGGKKPRSRR